jgi:hypothetical protein
MYFGSNLISQVAPACIHAEFKTPFCNRTVQKKFIQISAQGLTHKGANSLKFSRGYQEVFLLITFAGIQLFHPVISLSSQNSRTQA